MPIREHVAGTKGKAPLKTGGKHDTRMVEKMIRAARHHCWALLSRFLLKNGLLSLTNSSGSRQHMTMSNYGKSRKLLNDAASA